MSSYPVYKNNAMSRPFYSQCSLSTRNFLASGGGEPTLKLSEGLFLRLFVDVGIDFCLVLSMGVAEFGVLEPGVLSFAKRKLLSACL